MKITALLFDLDGLLFDTEKLYIRFWRQAARDCGYEMSLDAALAVRSCDSGIARRVITEDVRDPDAYDRIRARRKQLMKAYLADHQPELKPGAKAFLDAVRGRGGMKLLVVTQAAREEKAALLGQAGILECFDEIISAGDVRRGKPYPDVYLLACERAGVKPQECIAFEDSPNGIMSAAAAGVKPVMIPDLTEPDDELRKKCFGVYPSLMDALTGLPGLA